jgi:hypothetical protein
MRCRGLLLLSLVLAVGCQDKKPDGSAPAASTTNTPTGTVEPVGPGPKVAAAPPLAGTIGGKEFRPTDISLNGIREMAFLMFTARDGADETSIHIPVPLKEDEKAGGKEWSFGGKIDDPPVTILRPGNDNRVDVFGQDYTVTVKLKTQTRDTVDGEIDFAATKPPGTKLKGAFRAKFIRSPTAPLGPDDAPCVYGKIVLKSAKKTEKLAAGFVGIGSDGKPSSNEAVLQVVLGQAIHTPMPNPDLTSQMSILASTADTILYRHLNMPPGDYLVYVRRDTIMSAWKRVQIKVGELREFDFTIDPANTGELAITLPATTDSTEQFLALVPLKADLPDLGLGSSQYFSVATVKMGETSVKVSGIPAGKYRAVRGTDEAEVEVVAGKSVSVTLGPKK